MHRKSYHRQIIILLVAVTAFRLIGLLYSPLNLYGDEAQYWSWSRNLDFGYFSKPPMIAWLIASTTAVFGNQEWAIRLSSLLIHPITAYVIFRTGRYIFDERAGIWAAALYLFMPAVWLSSGIVSTDVGLLLCWAVALNGFFHLRQTKAFRWAILIGVFIGIGLLSKYAMLFFIPALIASILIDKHSRAALLGINGLIIIVFALAVVSPNLWWNYTNDFATVSHTASNANLSGIPFHPLKMLEFIVSQLIVYGPITFILLICALLASKQTRLSGKAGLLALFVLSPLLIITLQSLLSRANANWAVTAYVGGCLLTSQYISTRSPIWGRRGLGLNIALGMVIVTAMLSPVFANMIGASNGMKKVRGWPATEQAIHEIAVAGHEGKKYRALATDSRLLFFNLEYYTTITERDIPLYMWMMEVAAHHHAEATKPLAPSLITDSPVLIISHYVDCRDEMKADFERLEPAGNLSIALGGGITRDLALFAGYGYNPTTTAGRRCY